MSWTEPTLGGAPEVLVLVVARTHVGARVTLILVGAWVTLTLVGARAALTLVGALECWTEPAGKMMSWAGPAEEFESTCEA